MKKFLLILTILIGISCADENPSDNSLKITSLGIDQDTESNIEETLIFKAQTNSSEPISYQWKIDGVLTDNGAEFIYSPTSEGTFTISLTVSDNFNTDSKSISVKVGPPIDTAFVTEFLDYLPAPGQFVNSAFANLDVAKTIIKDNKSTLSLGGFGGYVSLGFDHNVKNLVGNDLIVYGNAFEGNSEPGIVWVMADANGNKRADETWYQLAGSEYDSSYTKHNYSVTYYKPTNLNDDVKWKDSEGNTGSVFHNSYHPQTYYPDWITRDSIAFTGTRLKEKISINEAGKTIANTYPWGYADNYSSEYQANRANLFDISNAVDKEGNKVKLDSIRFIKIQSAVLVNAPVIGNISTEIRGVADFHILNK